MATYSVSLLSPQPSGLLAGETALKISQDTSSENLHVAASVKVLPGSDGNPVVLASVRVILPDGSPAQDPNGNTCATQYGISVTPAVLAECTNLTTVQKCILMVALGLPFAPLTVDATVASNASIINRALAALANAPVNVASLLAPT